ncbi:MAG: FlgO family outer membrane protein, partial [Fidelibacterota bacterium]
MNTVIAVVDFENTGENRQLDYLERTIPEAIITNLAKLGKIDIVERARLNAALEEMQLSMSGVVDAGTASKLGKAVGASSVLLGSFVQIGEVIRINARLIDVETGKVIQAESVQGKAGEEIFNLMDQVSLNIIRKLLGKNEKYAGMSVKSGIPPLSPGKDINRRPKGKRRFIPGRPRFRRFEFSWLGGAVNFEKKL